jgi:cytochrome c551/c552
MKLLQGRYWVSLGAIALFGLVLAACAPNANARLISPELGAQLYAEESAQEVVVVPTPEPVRYAELAPEQVTAGLPEDFAAALAAADPSRGETIALVNGCVGCHNLDPAVVMAGPTWHNLADTAANRRAGESPALYIYESIMSPNAYLVPNYPSGVMPAIYQDTIPQEDLAALVAYLLQLHE